MARSSRTPARATIRAVEEQRPAIPRPLARQVLVEAGHRCAIPTCRHPTTELAHIVPWATVHEHTFDNLIALCPNDHTRYDNGEIDRQSMLMYKRNLGLLTSRYGEAERRLLELFAKQPGVRWFDSPRPMDFEFVYLLEDGLLVGAGRKNTETMSFGDEPPIAIGPERYTLTDMGVQMVDRLRQGLAVEDEEQPE
jgi:hypothetical protein